MTGGICFLFFKFVSYSLNYIKGLEEESVKWSQKVPQRNSKNIEINLFIFFLVNKNCMCERYLDHSNELTELRG